MRLDLLVNYFVYQAIREKYLILFEPHFKRNYIHIRDVVEVFLHCLKNFDQMKNQSYNVGLSDGNLSKLELCEEIRKQVPDFLTICSDIGKDPDKRNYIISNAKIEAAGFKPKYSIQNGITELMKVYQIISCQNQFSNA
jgi:nucleoside-diphosphate-sugar epimerase